MERPQCFTSSSVSSRRSRVMMSWLFALAIAPDVNPEDETAITLFAWSD